MNFRWILNLTGAILLISAQTGAMPPVIDDQELLETLKNTIGESVGKEGIPTAQALASKANTAPHLKPDVRLPAPQTDNPGNDYERLSKSVYLVSTVYKCGKCNHWHQGASASAWCVGEDGLMITNAHVFRNAKGDAMGVIDREGKCHPVTELLGLDAATDVALFRVKATGLQPLKLGTAPEVGTAVTIISNPDGNLFIRTAGSVARYTKRESAKDQPKVTWMTVTADYAKGSSGGPVFNPEGEVIGMVCSTHSIYTGSGPDQAKGMPKGELQMVIRNCVPVDAIRALFESNPAPKPNPG